MTTLDDAPQGTPAVRDCAARLGRGPSPAGSERFAVQALLDKVCVSRLAHGAVALVVAGHHDCAANPGDAAAHTADSTRAMTLLRQALPELPVRAVYVDSTWNVAALTQTPAGPPAAR